MPTIKLTQLAVDRIAKARPPPKEITWFDSQLPMFGLRHRPTGHLSWVAMLRAAGHPRLVRFTIGSLAEYTRVDVPRALAREAMQEADRGNAPTAATRTARRARETAEPEREPDTVPIIAAKFVERYCKPKNRSWRDTERLLKNHILPGWAGREATSITRRDVRELLDALAERGLGAGANRVLAAGRKMFGWAVEQEIVAINPFAGIKAPAGEVERDRVLSDDELIRVWRAAEAMGGAASNFVRMLALTGQRRDEVATIRWQDIDFDKALWTVPREATKADRSHEVPLAPLAVEILRNVPRLGTYVFTTAGERPISGYSKIKARADKLAGIEEDWRFHDLRRTAGTGMARLGIAVSTISRVLNHKEGGVTKIYNRYSYLDEKRHALQVWARFVGSLLAPAGSNVTALRA